MVKPCFPVASFDSALSINAPIPIIANNSQPTIETSNGAQRFNDSLEDT